METGPVTSRNYDTLPGLAMLKSGKIFLLVKKITNLHLPLFSSADTLNSRVFQARF
jgi:hypothetical protein